MNWNIYTASVTIASNTAEKISIVSLYFENEVQQKFCNDIHVLLNTKILFFSQKMQTVSGTVFQKFYAQIRD